LENQFKLSLLFSVGGGLRMEIKRGKIKIIENLLSLSLTLTHLLSGVFARKRVRNKYD